MFEKVAVVGAGRNLGVFIIQGLLAKGFQVTVLARSASTANFPPVVKVVKGDYSPTFLDSALVGQDAVILTMNAMAKDEQMAVMDSAVRVGVKRILPSEFGSDSTNPVAVKAIPFYQDKKELVNYVQGLSKANPATTWTVLITGPFFDWCLKHGFWSLDITKHKGTLYDQGTAMFDTTTLSTVGAAVASILLEPSQFANEYVHIHSFTTCQKDILDALKAATGVSDWEIDYQSAATYLQNGRDKVEKQDYSGVYDMIFAATYKEGYGQDYSSTRTLSNKRLKLEDEDLFEIVKQVVDTDRPTVPW